MRRYASDGFAGECISSNYEQSGDTLLVVDTNVVGNSGAVNNGVVTTATVTITEDGVLRKVFSNGNVQGNFIYSTLTLIDFIHLSSDCYLINLLLFRNCGTCY